MPDQEPETNETSKKVAENPSRRAMLVGSGSMIVGGVAGRATASVTAATSSEQSAAPPLPWKWPKIDPMEAGTRTYHAYLQQGG